MKKQHNISIINWNLLFCDDLQFIEDHICFLNSYFIYDINKNLISTKNQVSICQFKYNCNEAMLSLIKSKMHIQLNYFILELPVVVHNRKLCLIQKTTENSIGLVKVGLINNNYLITFKQFDKVIDN